MCHTNRCKSLVVSVIVIHVMNQCMNIELRKENQYDILAFTKITENLANICILVGGTNRLDKVMNELEEYED